MLLINDLRRHQTATAKLVEVATMRVLGSGWFVMGNELDAFERAFASYCSTDFACGVGNGTDAIELGLRSLGVRAGMTVATVANAGFYTVTALQAIGARPLFIDVTADTHLMDLQLLASALERIRIDAIVVTHLYGRLHDMPRVMELARRYGVPVLEDCAQAHGAMIEGRRAGSFGDAASFSFYPTKNLGAVGDGGAVVTSRRDVDETLRSLRQYGWQGKYRVVASGGRNSRLDELQAAVLLAKLPQLDGWNERRRAIARHYSQAITNPRITTPPQPTERDVAHLYVVRATERAALQAHLKALNIVADVHYPIPDIDQPSLSVDNDWPDLPVTRRMAGEVLTLPCFPELTDSEVELVVDAVNAW